MLFWFVPLDDLTNILKIKRKTESEIIDNYLEWLKTRIDTTRQEKAEATDLNLIIGKGGKLCVYKEIFDYIRKHR